VGDDYRARAGWVRLRERGDGVRDGGQVGRVGLTPGRGPGGRLGFVAEDDVDIGEDLLELNLEELRDEWCGEVERERLRSDPFQFLIN
jgi:hypothetical protein